MGLRQLVVSLICWKKIAPRDWSELPRYASTAAYAHCAEGM